MSRYIGSKELWVPTTTLWPADKAASACCMIAQAGAHVSNKGSCSCTPHNQVLTCPIKAAAHVPDRQALGCRDSGAASN
eukprot:scaffold67145_cov17-Tisochrysis_lutea.AAC.1